MIVKHTKPFVTYIGDVRLFPGNNELNEKDSLTLSQDKRFKNACDAGLFQILSDAGTIQLPNKVSAAQPIMKQAMKISINNMALPNAVKIIQGMFNKEELNKLAETDMRTGIQNAIKVQIAKVDSMTEDKEDKEEKK